MGAGAADIAEVVSEVRERLPDLQPAPQLEPEQARFRLFDSITNFLKSAGQTQPLVLMLDDLHWADKPSMLLLEFLAKELAGARILVVGTYRDVELSRQHPLAETLGGLNRERLFQRVLLRGLSQEGVGRFIEIASGIAPPRGLVEAVHTQTEGNPLFVTEVVRLLVQEGDVTADPSTGPPMISGRLATSGRNSGRAEERESWTVRIPQGVREVIGRRLNRLSQRCNETLTMASVIGREFALEHLRPLINDMIDERLLEALEEALAARVIEELPQSVGRYQFTHALIQQTLAEELSSTRRGRIHARIANALEDLYGAQVEDHAAELAHHFAEAEAIAGVGKLARYSRLAGERALASHAYEDAFTHFERGLAARNIPVSGTEAAFDDEAAALLFGMGRALATIERPMEAFATLSRAFAYYAEAGNISLAVAVAEFPIALPATRIPGVTQLLARALTLVPADSYEAGRLLSRYGGILGAAEGDYEGAQQALGRAIAIARREGDMVLEVRTLTYAAAVSGRHLHWQESVDNGLRAIDLATGDESPYSDVVSRYWTAQSLLLMGDLNAARRHVLVLRDLAGRRSTPRQLAGDNFTAITSLACLEADWKTGREYSDLGLEPSSLSSRLLLPRVLLEHETGETAQGQVYLERLLDGMRRTGPDQLSASGRGCLGITAVARITGVRDHLEIVEATADTVLSAESVTPQIAIYAKAGLALLALEKGDQPAAEEHYVYFIGHRGTMIATVISVDRLLGLLSQTMGDLEQATAHFEDALEFCGNGCRPELAWTCCDYADALRERAGPDDRARAIALLDESLTITSALGMRPLMERVLARKLDLQGVASMDPNTSIDAVASAVENERPDLSPHAAPDGTVTILFSDIEGCTAMTQRLGDQAMHEVIGDHNALIRREVASHGGFEVKSMGDGFMLAFSSARRGLQCAMAIQQAFNDYNQEHPREPIRVRMGLHTGEAIKDADDFYGRNVILAYRIADQAQGGQILVSSLLKELTESAGDLTFGEEREVELKGLPGVNRVYQVVWE